MSGDSAYLIPLDGARLDDELKFRVLRQQIQTSLDLIEHNTLVASERERLGEVWSSFLDHVVADFGSNAIGISESVYLELLRHFSSLRLGDRLPWFNWPESVSSSEVGADLSSEKIFALVPRGTSTLPGLHLSDAAHSSYSPEAPVLPGGSNQGDVLKVMSWALRGSHAFPSALFKHQEITSAIHSILYDGIDRGADKKREEVLQPSSKLLLRVSYRDGTVGAGLELTPLPPARHEEADFELTLNLGLISNRHFETDQYIDLYLLRNAEMNRVGSNYSYAMQEQFAYEKTMELFKNLPGSQRMLVRVYPAGLEPANVGFVRAIVDILREGGPNRPVFEIQQYRRKDGESFVKFA